MPKPIEDRGLYSRGARGTRFVPESDQQEGAQSDQFPAEQDMQKRPAQHQREHRKAEQRQIGEESLEAYILAHAADAEHMDEHRNERDHREHGERQAVDIQTQIQIARVVLRDTAPMCRQTDGNPSERDIDRPGPLTPFAALIVTHVGLKPTYHGRNRADETEANEKRRQPAGEGIADPFSSKDQHAKADQRQQGCDQQQ